MEFNSYKHYFQTRNFCSKWGVTWTKMTAIKSDKPKLLMWDIHLSKKHHQKIKPLWQKKKKKGHSEIIWILNFSIMGHYTNKYSLENIIHNHLCVVWLLTSLYPPHFGSCFSFIFIFYCSYFCYLRDQRRFINHKGITY